MDRMRGKDFTTPKVRSFVTSLTTAVWCMNIHLEMFETKGELYKWCQDDAMNNNGYYADRMYKDEDDDLVCEPDCPGCQGVDLQ